MLAATKGPQVEDLGTAFANSKKQQLTLASLGQQQTMNTQKIASDALVLQNQQRDQADDKAINDALAQYTSTGPDGQPKLDQDGAVSSLNAQGKGQAAAKLSANITLQNTNKAKQIEAQNAAQTSNLSLVSARSGELAKLAQAVQDAPPEGKQAAYTNMHQQALHLGLITPEMQSQFPDQYDPSQDPHLNALILGAQDAKTRSDLKTAELTRGKDQAEIDKGKLATAESWRVSGATQLSLAANPQQYSAMLAQLAQRGAPPDVLAQFPTVQEWTPDTPKTLGRSAMTQEQRVQADATAARDKNTAVNEAAQRQQGAARLGIEAGQLKIAQQRYGYDTAGVSPAAQMAADGRMDPATLRMMLRSNPGLLGQIQRVDPQFDEANMDSRFNTLKEFNNTSTGKAGGQALALNTVIHHADLYMQTAQALQNGTFRPGNAVYNAVANTFGAAPPTDAALVGRFFAGETGKVATGGVPAEGEINGILKNLSTDASPEQIANAGKTLLQIAGGRATPLMERVNQAKLGNVIQVLGPDAKAILARNGFDPNTMKPATGATYANTATGKDGHKIGTNDSGKTWFDVQTGAKVQ